MRKETQKKKEEKWEMIRWLNKFIEENKDNWKREKQKRDEEKEMTVYKWEKRRRFEKIEEIKKRRENAKKIPHLDYKELWSWRENQNQGEIMTPHTTPQTRLINCMLQDTQTQESQRIAAATSIRSLTQTEPPSVARPSQEVPLSVPNSVARPSHDVSLSEAEPNQDVSPRVA